MNNGKHGQGTHCTKMVADSLAEIAEIAENAPEFICPSPKALDFNDRRLYLASIVCADN